VNDAAGAASLTVLIQINVSQPISTAISSLLFRGAALTSAVDELDSRGGWRKTGFKPGYAGAVRLALMSQRRTASAIDDLKFFFEKSRLAQAIGAGLT